MKWVCGVSNWVRVWIWVTNYVYDYVCVRVSYSQSFHHTHVEWAKEYEYESRTVYMTKHIYSCLTFTVILSYSCRVSLRSKQTRMSMNMSHELCIWLCICSCLIFTVLSYSCEVSLWSEQLSSSMNMCHELCIWLNIYVLCLIFTVILSYSCGVSKWV